MPVALLPPRTSSYLMSGPRDLVLTKGPRYARKPVMGLWHRTRSGFVQHPTDWRPGYSTVLRMFCGQSICGYVCSWGRDAEPDDGLPLCGTCVGRAIGAGLDDPITGRELSFTPRWLVPPKVCPGSMKERLVEPHPGNRTGRCLVCGDIDRCRSSGSPYAPRWGLQRHPPGPGLIPACPFHGWAYVTRVGDRAGCYGCTANEYREAADG